MLILIMITFSLIVVFIIPGLIQQKYWKELIVFCMLLLLGFSLSILIAMGVNLPSVSNIITQVFKTILHIKE